jgi:hypothetical protein
MKKTVTIHDIDAIIRHLSGEHPEARPFLCDGSPIGSEVFLVGVNPGTDTPFWPYWRLPYGCHKNEWLDDYLRRHLRFKPTRARIEILFQAISPIKCLETNVFFQYSPDESSLRTEAHDTRVFDYLLTVLSPKVLFIHGASGIKHMEQVLKTSLPQGQFTTVTHNGREIDVITGRHLSRGWSYERVDALGEEIRERCVNRRESGCKIG